MSKERVKAKLKHWNLEPKCSKSIKKMQELESKRKLSFWRIKELAQIKCTNCEQCLGQTTLDSF